MKALDILKAKPLVGGLLLLLTSWVWSAEYEVAFEQAQIQQQIDSLLPITKQSPLAEVEVKAAQLTLLEKEDRLEINAQLNVVTLGDFKTKGNVILESGVRYEPSKGEFYFQQVKVLDLQAEQIPPSLLPQLAAITEQILNQVLVSYPIYTLDHTEINQHLLKSSLKAVKVRDKKLVAVMEL